jgi:cytochrome bd-type quinol oxidase subunit 2
MIAVCQIVGGSALVVFLLGEIVRHTGNWTTIAAIVTLITIAAASVIAGIWLWNGDRLGYGSSILVQILQIPVISCPLIVYKFVLGFGVTIFLTNVPPNFGFDVGGQGFLIIGRASAPVQIGINLFAIFVLSYLLWRYRAIRDTVERDRESKV